MRFSTRNAFASLLVATIAFGANGAGSGSEAADPGGRRTVGRPPAMAVAYADDAGGVDDAIERELRFSQAVAASKTGDLASALAITEQAPHDDTLLAYQHAILLLRTGDAQRALV